MIKNLIINVISLLLILNCATEKSDGDKNQGRLATILLLTNFQNYSQTRIDADTGFNLSSYLTTVYNTNIAGTVGSTVNVSKSCTTSTNITQGTFSITGTAIASNATTTLNLSYTFTNCILLVDNSLATSNFTLGGIIVQTGTLTSTATSNVSTSVGISLVGTQSSKFYSFNNPATINESNCPLRIVRAPNILTSGTVCGRPF